MAERDEVRASAEAAQAMVPGSAAEALAKHEAEKMSRRAVLAKVGLRFGLAALAAFSVDDLARQATAAIALRAKDNAVAQQVAKEFRNAGVAFATDSKTATKLACDPPVSGGCIGCSNNSLASCCQGDAKKVYYCNVCAYACTGACMAGCIGFDQCFAGCLANYGYK